MASNAAIAVNYEHLEIHVKEQPADDVTDLLIGFCRSELTLNQERTLLERAATDQDVFDQLMEIDALREALASPEQRLRLDAAFNAPGELADQSLWIAEPGPPKPGAISETWGGQYECPSVDEIASAARVTDGLERESVNRHITETRCLRCKATLDFLSTDPETHDVWLDAIAGIIEAVKEKTSFGDESLRVTHPLNPFGLRISFERQASGTRLAITSINPAHIGQSAELFLLTDKAKRLSAILNPTSVGTLKANIPVTFVQALLETSSALAFLLRVREVNPFRQKIAHIVTVLRGWLSGNDLDMMVTEPSVAILGSGSAQPTGILGIVAEVKNSLLLLQLAPEARIEIGTSLKLVREDVFVGLAVVVEIGKAQAVCQFQSSRSEVPQAGDLASGETEY